MIVHAAKRLELGFDKLTTDLARLDAVSIQWKVSRTVQNFEAALRAHCQREIFAGVLGNPKYPEVIPLRFISTRQMEGLGGSGGMNLIHPCTVASGACGACLKHCCPPVCPVPEP